MYRNALLMSFLKYEIKHSRLVHQWKKLTSEVRRTDLAVFIFTTTMNSDKSSLK